MEFNKVRWRSHWQSTLLKLGHRWAVYAGAIGCQAISMLALPTTAIGWGTVYSKVTSWIGGQPDGSQLPIVRAAPSSPQPAPPDSGGPRRSQGSGTR